MRLRPFGATQIPVQVVGQGTWTMERDRRASVAALHRGLDLGMTHIDTAEMYGSGAVEEVVGDAIQGRRDEVFLVSKVLPSHATSQGIVAACEASLRRLRTDRLDVYLLHSPSRHPFAETLDGFRRLVAAGKIRAFGVSNFDDELLDQAVALAGPGAIACNQVLYHLGDRWIEHGLIDRGAAAGVAVVGYSPFGQGDFPDHDRALAAIAATAGATPRQVALAFLLRLPGTFTIPKSSSVAHVEENAGAGELELDPEAIARIDAAFPVRVAGGGLGWL